MVGTNGIGRSAGSFPEGTAGLIYGIYFRVMKRRMKKEWLAGIWRTAETELFNMKP